MSEPYLITAVSFDPETQERQYVGDYGKRSGWTDLPSIDYGPDDYMIVRNKPKTAESVLADHWDVYGIVGAGPDRCSCGWRYHPNDSPNTHRIALLRFAGLLPTEAE